MCSTCTERGGCKFHSHQFGWMSFPLELICPLWKTETYGAFKKSQESMNRVGRLLVVLALFDKTAVFTQNRVGLVF